MSVLGGGRGTYRQTLKSYLLIDLSAPFQSRQNSGVHWFNGHSPRPPTKKKKKERESLLFFPLGSRIGRKCGAGPWYGDKEETEGSSNF